MSKAHAVTLIVPELLDVPTLAAEQAGWRQLSQLAGRGSVRRIWRPLEPSSASLRPWQHGLLAALGLDSSGASHASAPVSMCGTMREHVAGYWMHAELVHLAASMDSLSLVPLQSHAAVRPEERAELQAAISDHLGAQALSDANTSAGWMVAFDRRLGAVTVSPEAAARSDLAEAMPRGDDAGMLRRLMTECQMLLHEHAVNARRARNELPAINAVWLWGGGEVAPPAARSLPSIAGNDPYVVGLCVLHRQPCLGAPSRPAELPLDVDIVAVIEPIEVRALEEQWLAPLTRSVAQGVWGTLNVMIEGWQLSVSRGSLWRFWRRPRPPLEWTA